MVVRSADEWADEYRAADPETQARIRAQYLREKADKEAHPLAYAVLWDNADPSRTSQRRTAQKLIADGVLHGFALGGNRSGKSELGAILDVCYAMGKNHPDVQRFAKRNGLDISALPDGPGKVWSVALDSSDSRRYVRPKVARYLPPGAKWRNQYGDGESEVRLPGGGEIVFKMVSQGADGFQGDAVDLIRFDEECRDLAVIKEARMRCVDRRGRLLFTMTPLYGWTDLLLELVQSPAASTAVDWLHGTDNPHIPADYLRELLENYGEHERAARERGEIVALEGRVYDFGRSLHLISAFAVPGSWAVYVAWDFGTRNPTAILVAALDPKDDVLHLIAGRYERERTLSEHATWVRAAPWFKRRRWVVADAADRGARLSLAKDHGIQTRASKKGIRTNINAVAERLRPNAEGRPALLVHDVPELAPLVREIEGYVWDQRKSKNDLPDLPQKKNDHFMDALGYLCRELRANVVAVG